MACRNRDKMMSRIFPPLDKRNMSRLRIDRDSTHYISTKEQANEITDLIVGTLTDMGLEPSGLNIIDGTAGVGGNTISFSKVFNKVYAVEIEELRYRFLKNNVDVYGLKNVTAINENCCKIFKFFRNGDVVFLDPPWGGRGYKNIRKMRITMSGFSIEDICNNLMNSCMMSCVPKLIALKLPVNYDYEFLLNSVKKDISIYRLDKMNIVMIRV